MDYRDPTSVIVEWKKLHFYSQELINMSGYHDTHGLMNRMTPGNYSSFAELFRDHDLRKLYLGIGMELLLKAFFMHQGYVVHKVNGVDQSIKIIDLRDNDVIDWKHMVSFEQLKNRIPALIDTGVECKAALELVQEWRNGIAHQAQGPGGEDSGQWIKIQHCIADLHNPLLDN
jgi:hypothetical protein